MANDSIILENGMLQAHALSRDIIITLFENMGPTKGMTVSQILHSLESSGRTVGTEKTIRKHLVSLKELRPFGLAIENDGRWWRVVPILDVSQLRLLADGLLELRLDPVEVDDIIGKLRSLAGPVPSASLDFLNEQKRSQRSEQQMLLNIAKLDEAILQRCAVAIQRNKWNVKGELVPRIRKGQPLEQIVFPYQMVVKSGKRYLVYLPKGAYYFNAVNLNKVHNVRLIPYLVETDALLKAQFERGSFEVEQWIDERLGFSTEFWAKPVKEYRVHVAKLDPLFNEFPNAQAKKAGRGKTGYEAVFTSHPDRVAQWALQPLNRAEVLEPIEERIRIKGLAEELSSRYSEQQE